MDRMDLDRDRMIKIECDVEYIKQKLDDVIRPGIVTKAEFALLWSAQYQEQVKDNIGKANGWIAIANGVYKIAASVGLIGFFIYTLLILIGGK